MSKKNEILLSIALDGDSEVKRKIKDVGETGKRSLGDIGNKLGGAKNVFGGGNEAARSISEAIHTLHPVLETAGLGFGNLGAFARLAGASMAALGAAITGSVLIGLAKIGEASERVGARLKTLTGSGNAFSGLKDQAKALGVNVSDLAPNYERLVKFGRQIRADQNQVGGITHPQGFVPGAADEAASRVQIFNGRQAFPGGVPTDQTLSSFHQALIEGSRLDKTPKDDAVAGIGTLLDSILPSGQVKSQDISTLQKLSPSLAQEVAKSLSGSSAQGGLGRNFENPQELISFLEKGGGQLSTGQLISAAAKAAPDIHERATAVSPGIGEAFDKLEASAKRVAEAFSGDSGVVGAIEKLSQYIDGIADRGDKILHPRDYEPGGPKFVGPITDEQRKEYNKPSLLDIGQTFLTGKSPDKRFDDSNAIKVVEAISNPERLPGIAAEALGTLTAPGPGNKQLFQSTGIGLPRGPQPSAAPVNEPSPPVEDRRVYTDGRRYSRTLNPTEPPAPAPVPDGFVREGGGFLIKQAPPPPESIQQPKAVIGNIGDAGQDVASAITEAAHRIRSSLGFGPASSSSASDAEPVKQQFAGGGAVRNLDDGGHISGPGTTTSDSIPAMLSDKEYVIKASSARKAGRGFLDWLNAGNFAGGGPAMSAGKAGLAYLDHLNAGGDPRGFADGGAAVTGLGAGSYDISPTDDGGAIINGVKYERGSPVLNDPVVKQALARARASRAQDEKPRHKSDFTGTFGGHVFDTPGGYAKGGAIGRVLQRLAGGGSVGSGIRIGGLTGFIDVPHHLALGGAADVDDAVSAGPAPSLSNLAPAGGFGDLSDFGRVELADQHGSYKVIAHRDVVRELSAAGRDRSNASTGSPSWKR